MKPRQWMQVAAVASAIGLAGTAIANDMDRTPGTDDISASTLDNPSSTQMNEPGAAPSHDNGTSGSAMSRQDDDNSASDASGNASSSTPADVNAAPDLNRGGDLNGSADVNANPPAVNDNATATPDLNGQVDRGTTSISGGDRLGGTNSDNFNTWASDYASQHNGHITRQDFLAEMGNRWDQADTQHQGYLTPDQVQQLMIVTPGENSAPARTGSEAQPGDFGPGNVRGE